MRMIDKVDRKGKVVAVYLSVAAACRENFISESALRNRCDHIVDKPYDLVPGCTFEYHDR